MQQLDLEPVRPLSEGANIESWIGFKHFSYLAEAAAQGYLRVTGLSQDQMLNQLDVSVDITELRMRLPSPLYADSVLTAQVQGERPSPEELPGKLRVRGTSDHAGRTATCFETSLVFSAWPRRKLDDGLAHAHRESGSGTLPVDDDDGTHVWSFTIPYPYCRASSVIQFDGYVRLIEEAIERLLRDRGISVRRLLVERGWIPVVTGWRISITAPAFMEETLIIRTRTTGVFKSILWDTEITFSTLRGGTEVEVARSSITHGYANTRGDHSGQMATFDAEVLNALRGDP